MAPGSQLEEWVIDARARTLDLVRDLSDEQFRVPLIRTINPFLWEIGHAAYFQEYWVLRHAAGRPPMRADADALYDSAKVAHDTRWSLPLPSREATMDYLEAVRDQVLDRIASPGMSSQNEYFILLSIFHEDMHDEAFTVTRQTLGLPAPTFSVNPIVSHADCSDGPLAGDVTVPGGNYLVGSTANDGLRRAGRGVRACKPSIPFTGNAIPNSAGSVGTSIDGFGWNHTVPLQTCAGLRRKRIAGAWAGGCLQNMNGKLPRAALMRILRPISTGRQTAAAM